MNLDNQKLTKTFIKALQEAKDGEGRTLELPTGSTQTVFWDLKKCQDQDEIEIGIVGDYLNNYMILHVILGLMKEGHVTLQLNDTIPDKDINYLNKLME